MIRRAPLLLALLLAACEADAPPPGEAIGNFHFSASLQRGGAEKGHCTFQGAPSRLSFDATLSHDPKTGALWLTTGGEGRKGRMEGSHFEVRIPPQGAGVPRELDTCTLGEQSARRCPLTFTEIISGTLLASDACVAALGDRSGRSPRNGHEEQGEEEEEEEEDPGPCPRSLADGSLDWTHCECIIGTLVERVLFPEDEACLCTGASRQEPAPERCDFIYSLEGRPG